MPIGSSNSTTGSNKTIPSVPAPAEQSTGNNLSVANKNGVVSTSTTPLETNAMANNGALNFADPVTMASVLAQQQQNTNLLGQMPLLSPQVLVEQLLPLQHQLQQQQQQQQAKLPPETVQTSTNTISINPMSIIPGMSTTDPQALWQQALQSLTGAGASSAQFVGAAAAAAAAVAATATAVDQNQQQQQQFQQLVSSFPIPTDLSQLAMMYPLQQQQSQAPVLAPLALAQQAPTLVQLQQQQPQQQAFPFQGIHAVAAQPIRVVDYRNGSGRHSGVEGNSNDSAAGAITNTSNSNSNGMELDDSQKKDFDENDDDDMGGERPSIVSFSNNLSNFGFNEKPPERKSERELSKMTESERRRYERNLREQQRSYKISQQIKQLRDVLAESNIPFRPNKYSILVSVAEYIKQLQSRAIMLDAEHQRLIDTIRKTNDMVTSGAATGLMIDYDDNNSHFLPDFRSSSDPDSSSNLLLVPGIDYRNVFDNCPYPMGIATLDGRVLAANEGFEDLLSCARGQMVDQSLFVYIRNHQEIFEAMAALLKRSSVAVETVDVKNKEDELLYWTGEVLSPRGQKVCFTKNAHEFFSFVFEKQLT
jgi:PAS domain-containing protein